MSAVPWPSRAEFLAWGLLPCGETGCMILLSPAAVEVQGGLCRVHLRERKRVEAARRRPARKHHKPRQQRHWQEATLAEGRGGRQWAA